MSLDNHHIIEHLSVLKEDISAIDTFAKKVSRMIIENTKNNGVTVWAGNGGSASQASHLAAELMGRYQRNRPPIPSLSLAADNALTTCVGNDFGFEQIFTRQIEGLKSFSPIVILLSTSGCSDNILGAASYCHKNKIPTVTMTGTKGKKLSGISSLGYICSSDNTAIIQELHLLTGHLICEYVEKDVAL